jgi:hypothetical protein
MSRSRKTGGSSNPVKVYLSFKGGKGVVEYYNKDHKDADEKGKVHLSSLDFAVLDTKASISGFNEGSNSGVTSNYLDTRDLNEQDFIVKTKEKGGSYGEVLRGKYQEIKSAARDFGGKFTTNIFALADVGNGFEIVKLELNGSGLTPWIKFGEDKKDHEIEDKLITISRGQLMKRSAGKNVLFSDKDYSALVAKLKKDPMADKPVLFYEPKFEAVDLSTELAEQAMVADEALQDYLDGIMGANSPAKSVDEPDGQDSGYVDTESSGVSDDDDLPF